MQNDDNIKSRQTLKERQKMHFFVNNIIKAENMKEQRSAINMLCNINGATYKAGK